MKNYNCIFLDRDGTLNPDSGYIDSLDNFKFFDFTISSLMKIANDNNQFCIISNQSGIGRGIIKQEELFKIHNYIKKSFKQHNIPLLDIYFCADHPDSATERRKPGPGMFLEAEIKYNLSLMDCLMIGDSIDDMRAGEMLCMDTMLVLTGEGEKTYSNLLEFEKPTYIVNDLSDGADLLCQ